MVIDEISSFRRNEPTTMRHNRRARVRACRSPSNVNNALARIVASWRGIDCILIDRISARQKAPNDGGLVVVAVIRRYYPVLR